MPRHQQDEIRILVECGHHLRFGLITGEWRLGLILGSDLELRFARVGVEEVCLRTDGDMAREDHELARVLTLLKFVGEPGIAGRVHPAAAVKQGPPEGPINLQVSSSTITLIGMFFIGSNV